MALGRESKTEPAAERKESRIAEDECEVVRRLGVPDKFEQERGSSVRRANFQNRSRGHAAMACIAGLPSDGVTALTAPNQRYQPGHEQSWTSDSGVSASLLKTWTLRDAVAVRRPRRASSQRVNTPTSRRDTFVVTTVKEHRTGSQRLWRDAPPLAFLLCSDHLHQHHSEEQRLGMSPSPPRAKERVQRDCGGRLLCFIRRAFQV